MCQNVAFILFAFIDTCATAWSEITDDKLGTNLKTIRRHGMSNGNQFPEISFRGEYVSKANFCSWHIDI